MLYIINILRLSTIIKRTRDDDGDMMMIITRDQTNEQRLNVAEAQKRTWKSLTLWCGSLLWQQDCVVRVGRSLRWSGSPSRGGGWVGQAELCRLTDLFIVTPPRASAYPPRLQWGFTAVECLPAVPLGQIKSADMDSTITAEEPAVRAADTDEQ